MSPSVEPHEVAEPQLHTHDRSRQRPVTTSSTKIQSLLKIITSVILLLTVQTNICRCSESTQGLNNQLKHYTKTLSELDPIVFDTQSLYKHPTRHKRAASPITSSTSSSPTTNQKFVDSCQSRMEVLTPYYATNSKGKLRTIVNSELMQQAIQIETCVSPPQLTRGTQEGASNKCNAQAECGCEQKYKWHRLLALDPADGSSASKGLFMDWFLFPSNCVCRCKSAPNSSAAQFLRTMMTTSKRPHQTTE